jgi:hypothetical protein
LLGRRESQSPTGGVIQWTALPVRIGPVGDAIWSYSKRLRDREGADRLAEATRDEY